MKKQIGDRLRAHGTYCRMLSEYKRCWRLDYAKETQLHLDITPAVNHSTSRFRDLAVADKATRQWHESNPVGYGVEFAKVAALMPLFAAALRELRAKAAAAEVVPLPQQRPLKGCLRRTVQLVKRHRSLYFEHDMERAPISVILTTLAAKSYARVVHSGRVYDNEFDVVADIVRGMSSYVEHRWNREWWVPNDTTEEENFAEKWNHDARLPAAFYEWHRAAIANFDDWPGPRTPKRRNGYLSASSASASARMSARKSRPLFPPDESSTNSVSPQAACSPRAADRECPRIHFLARESAAATSQAIESATAIARLAPRLPRWHR